MFKWIKKVLGVKNASVFQDEDIQKQAQEHSEEIRKLKAEVRRAEFEQKLLQEQMKLDRIRESSARLTQRLREQNQPQQKDEDGSAMEMMLMGLFMKILMPQGTETQIPGIPATGQQTLNQQPSPSGIMEGNRSGSRLSNAEIKAEINKIPPMQKKFAQKMSDESIKSFIKKNFDYDDDTVNRTIAILKGKEPVEAS